MSNVGAEAINLEPISPSTSSGHFSSLLRSKTLSERSRVRLDEVSRSVGAPGIEPGTSRTRNERSTDELRSELTHYISYY